MYSSQQEQHDDHDLHRFIQTAHADERRAIHAAHSIMMNSGVRIHS